GAGPALPGTHNLMNESSSPMSSLDGPQASAPASPPVSPWTRIRDHKVLQWSLAYLGAALALAHRQELLAPTYHWPEIIERVVVGVLIVGFPIAVAVAWYHGHRGASRLSAGEMTVVSLLLVIGAGLLIALVRTPPERSAQGEAASRTPRASAEAGANAAVSA